MRAPDRRAMVERPGKDLSVRRQCTLLNLARSGVYRAKPITGADDLALMRRIDELHLELPFYGSRRMIFELNKEQYRRGGLELDVLRDMYLPSATKGVFGMPILPVGRKNSITIVTSGFPLRPIS